MYIVIIQVGYGHDNLIRGIAVNIYLGGGGGYPETMLILETPSKN